MPLYVGETAERARAEPEPSIMHFFREQAARLRASANRAGTSASEGRAERAAMLDNLTYEDALRGKIIIGTPGAVAEQLHALREELGLDGILAELNTGGRSRMTAWSTPCGCCAKRSSRGSISHRIPRSGRSGIQLENG